MQIFCIDCNGDIEARLTDGEEVYPHREDLYKLPFWICDCCGNFVGCHHKSFNRTQPLGVIPNKVMKKSRVQIHTLLDPLWKAKRISRSDLYAKLTTVLGRTYHTATLRTQDEVGLVMRELRRLHVTL